MKQRFRFTSESPTRIVGTYLSPSPGPSLVGRGRGWGVKDEKPILHTLILYHSEVYTSCEGVKDFSLKVYGGYVVLLLPSGINLLPSEINSLPSGNKPDGSEIL
jgi:hypothetical protein